MEAASPIRGDACSSITTPSSLRRSILVASRMIAFSSCMDVDVNVVVLIVVVSALGVSLVVSTLIVLVEVAISLRRCMPRTPSCACLRLVHHLALRKIKNNTTPKPEMLPTAMPAVMPDLAPRLSVSLLLLLLSLFEEMSPPPANFDWAATPALDGTSLYTDMKLVPPQASVLLPRQGKVQL